MTAQTFIKQLTTYDEAFDFMLNKNKSFKRAGNSTDIYCVVPGSDGDNFAVVDLNTAIELGIGYVWSFSNWVENPWTIQK